MKDNTTLWVFNITGWVLVGFLLFCLFIQNNENCQLQVEKIQIQITKLEEKADKLQAQVKQIEKAHSKK